MQDKAVLSKKTRGGTLLSLLTTLIIIYDIIVHYCRYYFAFGSQAKTSTIKI